MSFTLNDLVLRTMLDLNIIEAEETPSNADYEFVKQTIQSEFARLEAGGMQFSNQSTTVDQIDPAMFTLLSSHMGFCIGPAFQCHECRYRSTEQAVHRRQYVDYYKSCEIPAGNEDRTCRKRSKDQGSYH